MPFGRKSLYPSASVNKRSCYPVFEMGYFFTPDKEQDFINHFNNRAFTQFKDQASANL